MIMEVDNGRFNFSFGKYPRYLCRTITLNTEFENLSYNFRAFLVYNPFLFIFGTFHIAERWYVGNVLARIAFGTDNCLDFLTAIFGVHLVEYVFERCYIVVGSKSSGVASSEIDRSSAMLKSSIISMLRLLQLS